MKTTRLRNGAVSAIAAALMTTTAAGDQQARNDGAVAGHVNRSAVEQLIARYPERPRLAARMMVAKYGLPREAGSETLVWYDLGPYKRIMVTRAEIPHDFPKPHMDFLEHTIEYRVEADKADAILEFDGSVTLNRTAGEMSARCDLEGHNILTLNIAHDVATGKKDVGEARKAFAVNVVDDMLGKHPPYVEALQFQPMKMGAADPDMPNIDGSPKRGPGMGNAEVLGMVGAVNENEIVAAMVASKKEIAQPVKDFAMMLHKEHGVNLVKTMQLGERIDVTPMETPMVDKIRVKGAGELAELVPLDGDAFARAYLAAMVRGHGEVLAMIDEQLIPAATNDELKKHLIVTRADVAAHFDHARKLHAGMMR